MNLSPLLCKIQSYAWGSRSFIAALQGRPTPSQGPEAELWIGAHPGAPAEVERREGESRSRLDALINAAPERTLGEEVARRFHGELPFLMKVLAAAEPLSLQAHPNHAQAEAGFAREQAAGIPLDAPERSYKDPRHKPELLVALTPFVALCGFRPLARTRQLFAELGLSELSAITALLATEPPEQALRAVFERLITLPSDERPALVRRVRERAAELASKGRDFALEFAWVERLQALYPGDIGIVLALLQNLVELAPGEALYLPAGNLHAYLDGAGVEIMANSDNVLRGGLTKKAINVPELLSILRFEELHVTPLRAAPRESEFVYETPADEFELSYLRVAGSTPLPRSRGPELFLVTEGHLQIQSENASYALAPGHSAFVPACEGALTLVGAGTLFRARVPGV